MKNQLFRSGTLVAANYRAACRARSLREHYSKLCIIVEETDETCFWLEILKESGIHNSASLEKLQNEANELIKIMSSYRKKIKNSL